MVHVMDEYVFESHDDFLLLMPFGKAQRRNATVPLCVPSRPCEWPARRESGRARRDVPAGRSCRRAHAVARARARIWAELRAGRKPSAADLERWAGNAVSTDAGSWLRERANAAMVALANGTSPTRHHASQAIINLNPFASQRSW